MPYTSKKIDHSSLIIVISVIILLIGLGYLNNKHKEPEFTTGTTMQTEGADLEAGQMEQTVPPGTQPKSATSQPNQTNDGTLKRQGILLTSDNSTRGNLMLKTPNSTFYFRTSRDYSPLIGKVVTATANGGINQFSLIDIVENK